MARTQVELATAVLHKLGILDAAETASGDDFAYIKLEYTDKLEEWRDDGLVYWEANAIPNVVFHAIVKLMANEVSMAFGFSQSLAETVAQEEVLKRRLRRHLAKNPSGEATEFMDY